ncbi:MAG: flagellar basal-body rod protein FlgB [Planctomycetes bacterium RBG_13_63_9]|nr:MAG: flagellar basal-body rod protein FlgB [Planctomycetes bacterium RBG_13_63_9]
MLSNLFQSTTIPVLQEVVCFAQARHTVLAGNIANMDTPGYKVRDLSVEDFQNRLHAAIQRRREPPAPRSPGDPEDPQEMTLAQACRNPKTILHHDRSNVGMEHEVTEMVKNQMEHNLALSIMASQFRLLQAAISERA